VHARAVGVHRVAKNKNMSPAIDDKPDITLLRAPHLIAWQWLFAPSWDMHEVNSGVRQKAGALNE
jgi:hypothetical protein